MSTQTFKKPPPSDMQAYASLPGNITVNPLVWMRCFPAKTVPPAVLIALLIGLAVSLVVVNHSAAGVLPIGALCLYLGRRLNAQYRLMERKCSFGCLNPAKVVSVNPYLIAVYSDLTTRSGDFWPVIKIIRQPLERAAGPRLKEGDRLPTAALYAGNSQKPHWNDFYPVAVNCVTGNAREIEGALSRLDADPDALWQELDHYLAQVPTPTQPGLYWMSPPERPQSPLFSG